MESALMIGVIPVLYSAASDKSGYYAGRTLWLGLTSVYSLVVYVVRMPWYHIYEDFKCHGNIPYPCLMECFEQMFAIPVSELWCYFYFIFIILFFLTEFFMAQIRHKHTKEKEKFTQQGKENTVEMEKDSTKAIKKQSPSQKISFLKSHQEKEVLYLNLFHTLLQVSIQTVSFCLLTNKHLPLISKNNFHCSTDGCPGPYHCVIWEISEKELSLYTLGIFSIIIIILGTGSFVYSIYHHLLMARSVSKVWIF
ncbi:uncharacterized protein LOC118579510 [Onychomys torridus]|uniref:uncharacterized protein LOC118579510 n=1 Tax=Onychomys torridus TaxID=38674 RepID=UPI00167FC28F|nr:uncharacterized protein LOC118579510 [Onychomys torridus]